MKGFAKLRRFSIVIIVLIIISSCNTTQNESMNIENVLLSEWTGPYGGVPAFDLMKVEDVKPALEKAMELKLAEIDEIANNSDAPTFENTIVALERSGSALDRVMAYYGKFQGNLSSPEFREVSMEMAPKISEFRSKISQNKQLFDRIKVVYEATLNNPLEADQQRAVKLIYEGFARNGAELLGQANVAKKLGS